MTMFLSEDFFSDAELIVESSDDGKDLFLSGIMMQAEKKNRNGRTYTITDISEAVNSINSKLKNKESVMGELDHPPSLSINLDRVSHIMVEVKMDGNNAVGKLKILDTPMGNIAKTLIKAGVKIGVSSRGTGAVGQGGKVSNFVFAAMDIVATPSAPDAYPDSIMEALNIATNYIQTPPIPLTESVRNDKEAQAEFKSVLLEFINGLKK